MNLICKLFNVLCPTAQQLEKLAPVGHSAPELSLAGLATAAILLFGGWVILIDKLNRPK